VIRFFYLLCILILTAKTAFSQQLWINEIQAVNSHTIVDDFGEYDDWIELYNGSDSIINLAGLYISDDPGNLRKWRLPTKLDSASMADSISYIFLF
jgi:hypothetical protein